MKAEWKKRLMQAAFLLAGVSILILMAFTKKNYGHGEEGNQEVQEAKEKQEDTFQISKVIESCVRVQAEGHYGSGSIYELSEEDIIIVTNRHVLQYWNEDSYVTFFNGAVGSGRIIGLSETADVGFLSINRAFLTEEETQELCAVERSEAVLSRGDVLYMVDLASDVWQPVAYEGQVLEPYKYLEEFGTEMLYGESLFKPGMSGCGVFDREGKYVGMLTGGTEQNEIAAVPASSISLRN